MIMSQNITHLEAELGAHLLARDNRTVVATERGSQAFDPYEPRGQFASEPTQGCLSRKAASGR